MARNTSPSMRTPLGRVRGHGAGHGGTGHFIGERISSLALLILTPWFVVAAALTMPEPSYLAAIDFLSHPVNAVVTILLIATSCYHMCLGMQVIVDDYIGNQLTRTLLLAFNFLLCVAVGAAAIYSVLHVNFAGA